MTAPNKAQREKCWKARDVYWKCIEDNDQTKCKEQRSKFENSCSSQWVKYFDRRREYLKFQDKLMKEGFEPIDGNNSNEKNKQ